MAVPLAGIGLIAAFARDEAEVGPATLPAGALANWRHGAQVGVGAPVSFAQGSLSVSSSDPLGGPRSRRTL